MGRDRPDRAGLGSRTGRRSAAATGGEGLAGTLAPPHPVTRQDRWRETPAELPGAPLPHRRSGSGSESLSESIFPSPPQLSGAPSSCEACSQASPPWMNPRQRVSPTGSVRTPQGWDAGPAADRRRLRGGRGSRGRSRHRTQSPGRTGGARLPPSCLGLPFPIGDRGRGRNRYRNRSSPPLRSFPERRAPARRAHRPLRPGGMNPRPRVSPTGSARTPLGGEAGPAADRRRMRGRAAGKGAGPSRGRSGSQARPIEGGSRQLGMRRMRADVLRTLRCLSPPPADSSSAATSALCPSPFAFGLRLTPPGSVGTPSRWPSSRQPTGPRCSTGSTARCRWHGMPPTRRRAAGTCTRRW